MGKRQSTGALQDAWRWRKSLHKRELARAHLLSNAKGVENLHPGHDGFSGRRAGNRAPYPLLMGPATAGWYGLWGLV